MPIMLKKDVGYTQGAIEFYKRYKDAFGEVVKAKMIGDTENVNYKLTLTNSNEEELVFNGELTSGYGGEGCRGTKTVLELAGFPISDEFISTHESFELNK